MSNAADMYRAWRHGKLDHAIDLEHGMYADAGTPGNQGESGTGFQQDVARTASFGGQYGQGGGANPAQGLWGPNKLAYQPGADAYQYGGAQGGAAAQQAQYGAAGQAALGQKAAQVSNAYGTQDHAQLSGLAGYYKDQLAGTGPSLAAQQAKASTDQGIQAQMAVANSAHGALAGAGATRAAGQAGVQMQQQGAQNAVQGRIQEEQQAQQGMQGLSLGMSAQDQQNAQYAANLQEEQNRLGAATGLGYAGLGQQVGNEQLGAQMGQQSANLQAAGLGQNQGQFNTQQNNQMIGTAVGAGGALIGSMAGPVGAMAGGAAGKAAYGYTQGQYHDLDLAEHTGRIQPIPLGHRAPGPADWHMYADADFQEPGPGESPRGPAGIILREESGSPSHDAFMLQVDKQSGRLSKVVTAPLSPSEHAQAAAPHGAGPLGSPHRDTTHVGGGGGGGMFADADVNSDAQPLPTRGGDRYVEGHRRTAPQVGRQKMHDDPNAPAGHVSGGGLAVDLGAGQYGDWASEEEKRQADPLNALYSNFNGGEAAPRTLEDQKAERGRAAYGAQQASLHEQMPARGVTGALADAVRPSSHGSLDETGGGLVATGTPHTGPDTHNPAALHPMPIPSAQPGAGAGASPGITLPTGTGGAPVASWQDKMRPQERSEVTRGELAQRSAIAGDEAAAQQGARDRATEHTLTADAADTADREGAEKMATAHAEIDRAAKAKEDASLDMKRAGENFGYHPAAVKSMMNGLAIAMGAFGAGMNPHMQNYGLQIVNSEIDRDLERQKQEIEGKKGRVADLDSALAMAYRRTGDMERSLPIAKAAAIQQVKDRAAAIAAGHEQDSIGAAAQGALGKLTEEQGRADAGTFTHVVKGMGGGVDMAKVRARAAHIADASGGTISAPDAFKRALEESVTTGGAGYGVTYAKPGANGSGKESQKDADQVRAIHNVQAGIVELQALRTKHGGGALWSPDDQARAETINGNLRLNLAATKGRISKQVFDTVDAELPKDPLETKVSGLVGADPVGVKYTEMHGLLARELENIGKHPGGGAREPAETPE